MSSVMANGNRRDARHKNTLSKLQSAESLLMEDKKEEKIVLVVGSRLDPKMFFMTLQQGSDFCVCIRIVGPKHSAAD